MSGRTSSRYSVVKDAGRHWATVGGGCPVMVLGRDLLNARSALRLEGGDAL